MAKLARRAFLGHLGAGLAGSLALATPARAAKPLCGLQGLRGSLDATQFGVRPDAFPTIKAACCNGCSKRRPARTARSSCRRALIVVSNISLPDRTRLMGIAGTSAADLWRRRRVSHGNRLPVDRDEQGSRWTGPTARWARPMADCSTPAPAHPRDHWKAVNSTVQPDQRYLARHLWRPCGTPHPADGSAPAWRACSASTQRASPSATTWWRNCANGWHSRSPLGGGERPHHRHRKPDRERSRPSLAWRRGSRATA